MKITPPASSCAPDPKSPTWLVPLAVVGLLFIGNVCPAATTLVDYFNLQAYGTVSGGQTITDAMGNAQATLNTNANTSLTSSGLTISGGNSQVTGLNLAAGSLSGFTGSFTIQVWATIQSGGGSVLYAANNGPANGWIGDGFNGYSAIYGFTWGSCLSGGGTGNMTGTAYSQYGQTAGLAYSLSAGTLYDIVLTFDAATRTFRQYVNGALTGSQTNDFSQTSLAQAQNFTLGGGTATETWGDNSALSTTKSFLLYSGALSGSQVSSIHNLGAGASASAIQGVISTNSYSTYVWSGGSTDNNWNTAANWTNGVAPDFNTAVVFAGATQTTVNLDAGNCIRSLTFSPSAGGFTITNAANTLALTGGVTNSSSNPQTISVPVSLNSTQPISAASGNLIFGQNLNNNGNTVTFAGTGNLTLNGSLTGSGGVVQSGSGTVAISLPVFPAGSYSGNTVIQSGGTLRLINPGFRIITSSFSGAGNLMVCTNLGGASVGPLLLWGPNNLTGTTTVSNGVVLAGYAPNQSLGSTIRVLDGATFGVNARADTNYLSPASLVIGSSTGATLQFGLAGISEPGLAGTNNAPIRAASVTINGTATINIAACPFATNSFPLFTGYSSGTLALGSQPPGYAGKLTVSGTTVYYTVTNLDYSDRPFVHPGALSTATDFARMKAKVNAGAHPWVDSYNLLTTGASSNYQHHAQVSVIRNASSGNYQFLAYDATAAYELSLRWQITGDNNYADAAVRVLNAWASTCTNAGGDPNALLLALNGYQLACAAENLHPYTNWAAADLARFQWWFRHGPAPGVLDSWWVAVPEGWLQSRWGQCPEHEWANWDLCNMNELLAIGVFCDDRSVYNYALTYFKTGYAGGTSVQGNGAINRVIYQMHPGYMGQWQEAGRDQGHAMMGPALLGFFSEIGWNQGDDLFSLNANELLAGAEYETKWNESPQTVVENNSVPLVLAANTVPYVYYENCSGNPQTDLSTASRGNVRMGYDLIYNHYVNLLGVDAPYTGVYMSQRRPEGAGDNDVIGYTTLTHYLDPIAPSAVPAPSAVIAQVRNTAATISWWGSATATSYNVKRSGNNGASYATIAAGMTLDHYYVDAGLLPGSNYLYVVSAIVNGTETTNSLPVAVQANQLLAGTIIGTTGSADGSSTIYRVFDGSLRNWYDASNSSGGWAGLDLGTTNQITKVGYCPRPNNSGRMTGGRFQGCNLPDFSGGVVTLFTVPAGTADTFPPTMTYQAISNTNGYRYVRYLGPDNGYCNVAELEFYGIPGVASPPVPPALQAYLKFDESSGTSAADSTGHGWTGTLINGVTWAAGYSNNAVNLSGASQYVTLPAGILTNLNEFTISAWVKQTAISTWSRIFDFGTGQSAYMFLAPSNGANNVLRFAITASGNANEQHIDGTAALPVGVWKHVAVTIGGSRGVLYVDGVPVGTNSTLSLSPGSLGNTTQNYLGKSQFGDPYFNGQVDEFRIYNGALSAGEVATFVTPLAAPTGLAATVGDGQVALSWNASAGATSYNVKRATVNGGPYTTITNVTTTSFTDGSLVNGTVYYYVVSALNAVGESANSAQVSARPQSPVPPVPTGLSATAGDAQVGLSWNVSSGATSYNVKRATVNGGPYTTITNVAATGYTDVGLSGGTNYYYVVSALNTGGESANSTQASATPIGKLTGTVTGSAGSWNNSGNTITNVFDGNTNTSYDAANASGDWAGQDLGSGTAGVVVELKYCPRPANAGRMVGGQFQGANVADFSGGVVTLFTVGTAPVEGAMTVQSVTNATAFRYLRYVGPANGYCNVAEVEFWGTNGTPPVAPTAPAGLAAKPGNAQVVLGWNASSGATSYNVKRATVNGGPYTTITSPTGTNYTDTSVTNGTTYYYVVTALNTGGESSNSTQASATPQVSAPAAPTGLAATAGNAQVALGWNAASGATSYSVKTSTTNGGPYTVIASNLTSLVYTNTALVNGTTHYYVVSAFNAGGESANSIQASATPQVAAPSAPASLTAIPGNAQVVLSWAASTGATSYNVKRATVNGGSYATITNVITTGFTDKAVVNGTNYYYVVSALNAGGESVNSAQVSVTPTDLFGWWKFNETTGTTAADSGGGGNPGTLQSGATWVSGIVSNAVHLNGTANGYGSFPSGLVSTLNDFSMATWVKVDTNASWARVFDFGTGSSTYMFLVPVSGSGSLRYAITTNGLAGEQQINNSTALSTGIWHHVAVTLSGSVGILYVDGVAVGTNSSMTLKPSSLGVTTQNYLGKSQFGSDPNLNGSLDDLRLYSRALSAAEVSAFAAVRLPSPWATADIGVVGAAGAATFISGTYTLQGAGTNISGIADAFRFVYQPSSGDCSNTVRVVSLQNTGSNAKAGVMIRESLAVNAREAGVWVTPTNGIIFTSRTSTGGTTSTTVTTGKTAPYWVRIARSSNSFSAYYSTNGTAWTQLGSTTTISMATSAYIGMGVESGVTNVLNTATMDNTLTIP